uniref:Diphthamide biosynthesis protein 2 n=1 Tax=Piliocolobus tephrosceles TaxID=591936 RepID=A0A8C9GMV9_9PRIM
MFASGDCSGNVSDDGKSSGNIFIISSNNDNLLLRILLEYGCNYDVYSTVYDEKVKKMIIKKENEKTNRVFLKRYNLIEKCKECDVFGIVIGNVNMKMYIELKKVILYILRKNKKRCFTIATNKLNNAKLENFTDIGMYIILTCSENSLIEVKDFSKKIINPFEFFIAYNYLEWQCKYIFDFFSLLNIPSINKELKQSMYKSKYFLWELHSESSKDMEGRLCFKEEPAKSENMHIDKRVEPHEQEHGYLIDYNSIFPIQEQISFITKFNENSTMCKYFIQTLKENEKRVYKGVDMNYNTEEIPTVVQGLDGIAQRYDADVHILK